MHVRGKMGPSRVPPMRFPRSHPPAVFSCQEWIVLQPMPPDLLIALATSGLAESASHAQGLVSLRKQSSQTDLKPSRAPTVSHPEKSLSGSNTNSMHLFCASDSSWALWLLHTQTACSSICKSSNMYSTSDPGDPGSRQLSAGGNSHRAFHE